MKKEIIEIGLLYGADLAVQLESISDKETILKLHQEMINSKDIANLIDHITKTMYSIKESFGVYVERFICLSNRDILREGDLCEIKQLFKKPITGTIASIDNNNNLQLVDKETEKVVFNSTIYFTTRLKRKKDDKFHFVANVKMHLVLNGEKIRKNEDILMKEKGSDLWRKAIIKNLTCSGVITIHVFGESNALTTYIVYCHELSQYNIKKVSKEKQRRM